jgi:hypothetical protein
MTGFDLLIKYNLSFFISGLQVALRIPKFSTEAYLLPLLASHTGPDCATVALALSHGDSLRICHDDDFLSGWC